MNSVLRTFLKEIRSHNINMSKLVKSKTNFFSLAKVQIIKYLLFRSTKQLARFYNVQIFVEANLPDYND